jgi:hypothetical protein
MDTLAIIGFSVTPRQQNTKIEMPSTNITPHPHHKNPQPGYVEIDGSSLILKG